VSGSARAELAAGRYNNAVNRAYYRAFNAAIVALIKAGFISQRWYHDEVLSRFGDELTRRRKLYEAEAPRMLNALFERRLRADYGLQTASRRDAERSCRDAERFFAIVLP